MSEHIGSNSFDDTDCSSRLRSRLDDYQVLHWQTMPKAVLDQASWPEQMNLPGFKLHPLGEDLEGFWSVWVNGNWRVIFRSAGTHLGDSSSIRGRPVHS
jgi:proteic killer suppression protein